MELLSDNRKQLWKFSILTCLCFSLMTIISNIDTEKTANKISLLHGGQVEIVLLDNILSATNILP